MVPIPLLDLSHGHFELPAYFNLLCVVPDGVLVEVSEETFHLLWAFLLLAVEPLHNIGEVLLLEPEAGHRQVAVALPLHDFTRCGYVWALATVEIESLYGLLELEI